MGLVIWIAIFVKNTLNLLAYVDDIFGHDFTGRIAWYAPYQINMLAKQVALLELWDELNIPHNLDKQLSSTILPIIGFEVDLKTMWVTMPAESRSELTSSIQSFISTPPNGHQQHSLRNFQCLPGWDKLGAEHLPPAPTQSLSPLQEDSWEVPGSRTHLP